MAVWAPSVNLFIITGPVMSDLVRVDVLTNTVFIVTFLYRHIVLCLVPHHLTPLKSTFSFLQLVFKSQLKSTGCLLAFSIPGRDLHTKWGLMN